MLNTHLQFDHNNHKRPESNAMSILSTDLTRNFAIGFLIGGIVVLASGDFSFQGASIVQALATILP